MNISCQIFEETKKSWTNEELLAEIKELGDYIYRNEDGCLLEDKYNLMIKEAKVRGLMSNQNPHLIASKPLHG